MEKNELPCGVALVILGLIALVVVVLVKPQLSSDLAAWVQGIGSIGAIAAAYFLGERQASRNERLQRSLAEAQIEQQRGAFYAIAESVRDFAIDVDRAFSPDSNWNRMRASVLLGDVTKFHTDVLRAVPFHELGSAVVVRGFMKLHDELMTLKLAVQVWGDIYNDHKIDSKERNDYLAMSRHSINKAGEDIQRRVVDIHFAMYSSNHPSEIEAAQP